MEEMIHSFIQPTDAFNIYSVPPTYQSTMLVVGDNVLNEIRYEEKIKFLIQTESSGRSPSEELTSKPRSEGTVRRQWGMKGTIELCMVRRGD